MTERELDDLASKVAEMILKRLPKEQAFSVSSELGDVRVKRTGGKPHQVTLSMGKSDYKALHLTGDRADDKRVLESQLFTVLAKANRDNVCAALVRRFPKGNRRFGGLEKVRSLRGEVGSAL